MAKPGGERHPREPFNCRVVLAKMKLAQGDPVAAQSLLEQVPLDYSPWNPDLEHSIEGSPLPAGLRRGKPGDRRYSCEVGGFRLG